MIENLNRGLNGRFALVADPSSWLAFRSVFVMLSCILPGIFPVVLVVRCFFFFLGRGCSIASVGRVTVSFGLGLSATIHFPTKC